MKNIDIVIGANFGDEGKGSAVARIARKYDPDTKTVNILTNGGSQRAHSIVVNGKSFTFQHFGSATPFGAVTYFSKFFIMNPMQFANEHKSLAEASVKPHVLRDAGCRWSTPYDMIVNQITEEARGIMKHGSCGMGIWETVKRGFRISFDEFMQMDYEKKIVFLTGIRDVHFRSVYVPEKWMNIWYSEGLVENFINDCRYLYENTASSDFSEVHSDYDNLIFENGQGLLLNDPGFDKAGTTPSKTGVEYSSALLGPYGNEEINVHYVTRPYLTRHGADESFAEECMKNISSGIYEDRTNHYNVHQGKFKYRNLDLGFLRQRIEKDFMNAPTNSNLVVQLTHCDEMDRLEDFRKSFSSAKILTADRAEVTS